MHDPSAYLLGCIFLLMLAVYLFVPPLVIFNAQRFKATPTLTQFDLDRLPPPGSAGVYLREMDEELQSIRFERRAALTLPDAVPNVKALLVMYANPHSRDLAVVAIMYAINPIDHKAAMKSSYLELVSRFQNDDLEVIQTNNAQLLGSFPTVPGFQTYRFPHVEEVAHLFQLHQKLLEREHPNGRKSLRLDEEFRSDCVSYLQTVMGESYARQIHTGYLRYDPDSEIYRPTWKGALLMTWRELWPFKQILWEGVKAQAKRLERELV